MKIVLLAVLLNSSPYEVRAKWLPVVQAAAYHYKIDWKLLDAVIYVESTWNPKAKSKKGAMGLGQLMPSTAKELGVKNPWDPGQNIWGTALYLKRMNDRFCAWRLALAAYNAGPKRVAECGCVPDIPATKEYVERVVRRWDSIEADTFSSCRR